MAKTRGSKEGLPRDSSVSMPSEQRTSESNKQKISKIHDIFPTLTKDNIAKILQYYDDDESQAVDALTRDGGREALSNWAESGSLKNKNNKNKKKKKKAKKEGVSGMSATASFDADDSSSLHSSGNIDAEVEKDPQRLENENSILNDDVDKLSNERIKSDDVLVINEPESESKPTHSVSSSFAPEEASPPLNCDSEQMKVSPPLADASEKHDEPVLKKDKYRSMDNNYQKYPPRQRTNSFRRSKSSSMSEDQSSQNNSQSAAAPTKRGYEKCKKDLNRQTISLQRIFSQVDKGFEESGKKIKAVFADIYKNLELRQKVLEAELEKNKIDAMNLIKGRQDLAVELKKRVDRTSLSEVEWSDLRSDIKQFVTERKYDDDLGKTIWFHWADINEIVTSFGEVTPVKNVYSQRSQSALGNSASNNPEPSPSSSLANDEVESAADKNDVANISDAVELPAVEKEEVPTYNKTHSSENRTTRVYSNTKFNHGRFPGGNYHGQGYHRNQRGGGYNNRNYSYNRQNNYEGNYRNHPHHDRDNRMNEGSYNNDRNMNNPKDFKYKNQSRGNRNFNYSNRFRNNMGGHRHQEKHPEEPPHSASGNAEKTNVNGFVDN